MRGNYFIYILSLLFVVVLLSSCKSSNKAIKCKNEEKVQKFEFKKPYNYQTISPKRVKKYKTHKDVAPNITHNEIDVETFLTSSLDENELNFSREIILKRRRFIDAEPEYKPIKHWDIGGVFGFFIFLISSTLMLLSALQIIPLGVALWATIGLITSLILSITSEVYKDGFGSKYYKAKFLSIFPIFLSGLGAIIGGLALIIGAIGYASFSFFLMIGVFLIILGVGIGISCFIKK